MTTAPTGSKVIRLQAAAHRRLNELLDLFQLAKFGPIATHHARLKSLERRINHLLTLDEYMKTCCGKVA